MDLLPPLILITVSDRAEGAVTFSEVFTLMEVATSKPFLIQPASLERGLSYPSTPLCRELLDRKTIPHPDDNLLRFS